VGSFDHCSFALTGMVFEVVFFFQLMSDANIVSAVINFYIRDEEKKMGTLVKEDFGRPNRENTMVGTS